MKTDERTIEERLAFAHACTGEPLFAQALQRIEQLQDAQNVEGTKVVISYPEVLDREDTDLLVENLRIEAEGLGGQVTNIEVFVGQN